MKFFQTILDKNVGSISWNTRNVVALFQFQSIFSHQIKELHSKFEMNQSAWVLGCWDRQNLSISLQSQRSKGSRLLINLWDKSLVWVIVLKSAFTLLVVSKNVAEIAKCPEIIYQDCLRNLLFRFSAKLRL